MFQGSARSLNAAFARGIREAAELYDKYSKEKREREAANSDKVKSQKGLKPPMFTRIKTNRPVGDCPVYTEDAHDVQVCECKYDMENPCTSESECINVLLMTECQVGTCPAKEKCQNQRFLKRLYPKVEVSRTRDRGWGLFVREDVRKGDFIIEYVGELITMAEFGRRLAVSMAGDSGAENFYYMTMDGQRMIDAGPKGNIARFMNHSCDPNCETQKWTVNGDTRVGLFTNRAIPAGTELTFNYQFEAVGDVKKNCLCGAANCSGLIGEKVKGGGGDSEVQEATVKNGVKSGVKNSAVKNRGRGRIKKEKTIKKVWDDYCFRCFDAGELVMCDHKTCPKVYHLACLGRDKMPREKWTCPWHYCATCGKAAVSFCMHCPNAYCRDHNGVLSDHPDLRIICDEHEEELEDTIAYYKSVGGVQKLLAHPNGREEALVLPSAATETPSLSLSFSEDKMLEIAPQDTVTPMETTTTTPASSADSSSASSPAPSSPAHSRPSSKAASASRRSLPASRSQAGAAPSRRQAPSQRQHQQSRRKSATQRPPSVKTTPSPKKKKEEPKEEEEVEEEAVIKEEEKVDVTEAAVKEETDAGQKAEKDGGMEEQKQPEEPEQSEEGEPTLVLEEDEDEDSLEIEEDTEDEEYVPGQSLERSPKRSSRASAKLAPVLATPSPGRRRQKKISVGSSGGGGFPAGHTPEISPARAPMSYQGGNAPKYHVKCPEQGCEWKGRKTRFEDHMTKRHNLSVKVARQKINAVLNELMTKYEAGMNFGDEDRGGAGDGEDPNKSREYYEYYGKLYPKPSHGPGSAKYVRGKENLRVCPDRECRLKMRASNLVRHIKTKHPDIDTNLMNRALYDGAPDDNDGGDDLGGQVSIVSVNLSPLFCSLRFFSKSYLNSFSLLRTNTSFLLRFLLLIFLYIRTNPQNEPPASRRPRREEQRRGGPPPRKTPPPPQRPQLPPTATTAAPKTTATSNSSSSSSRSSLPSSRTSSSACLSASTAASTCGPPTWGDT